MVTMSYEKMGACNWLPIINVKHVLFIGMVMLMFSFKNTVSSDEISKIHQEISNKLLHLMKEMQEDPTTSDEELKFFQEKFKELQQLMKERQEDYQPTIDEASKRMKEAEKELKKQEELVKEGKWRTKEMANNLKQLMEKDEKIDTLMDEAEQLELTMKENAWKGKEKNADSVKHWMEKQRQINAIQDEQSTIFERSLALVDESLKIMELNMAASDEKMKRAKELHTAIKKQREKMHKDVISLDEWVMSAMEGDTEAIEEYAPGYLELKEQQLMKLASMDEQLQNLEKVMTSTEENSKGIKEQNNAIKQTQMKLLKSGNARKERLKLFKDEMEKVYKAFLDSQKREDL